MRVQGKEALTKLMNNHDLKFKELKSEKYLSVVGGLIHFGGDILDSQMELEIESFIFEQLGALDIQVDVSVLMSQMYKKHDKVQVDLLKELESVTAMVKTGKSVDLSKLNRLNNENNIMIARLEVLQVLFDDSIDKYDIVLKMT